MNHHDSNIRYFTRGGQILLHNLRMINQVLKYVVLICLVVFIMSNIGYVYLKTNSYERYLTQQWLWAKVDVFFDEKAIHL